MQVNNYFQYCLTDWRIRSRRWYRMFGKTRRRVGFV